MIIGAIIFLIIYSIINYLIGNRLLKSFREFGRINKKAFWFIYIPISYFYIIYTIFNKVFPKSINTFLAFIGSYYLIILFYLIIFFSISFIINYFLRNKKMKYDLYFISFLLSFILLSIRIYNARMTHITNYDIKINKKLNEPLSIALVSDIHLGNIIGNYRLKSMVKELNNLNADLIVIAGDLIDSDLKPVIKNNLLDQLKNIKSKFGTYFTLGNHEFYTDEVDKVVKLVDNTGVKTIRDNILLIHKSFYLIGRDDANNYNNYSRKSIEEIVSKVSDFDKNKPVILIDHNPDYIDESISNNVDLQLSGHTHNGQIFPLNIIAKSVFPLNKGYKKLDDTNLIVSSGYGTWGPQVRICSKSEIVLINLHN